MFNPRHIIKKTIILFLITLLISPSFFVKAQEIKNNNFIDEKSDLITLKFIKILWGWATGNATSGMSFGFRKTIAKINFVNLDMVRFAIFPPRWEYSDFYNVTAIFFNVNQTIPQGSFTFELDWVIAIIFE